MPVGVKAESQTVSHKQLWKYHSVLCNWEGH